MKKIAVFLIVIALCFSCGCNNQPDISESSTPDNKENSSVVQDVVDNNTTGTAPTVTATSQVGTGVFVLTGYCSMNTEKIVISGKGVTTTETIPFYGKDKKYFMTQVPCMFITDMEVKAIETGVDTPAVTKVRANHVQMKQNYMYRGEYSPVFCLNSRIHYYSALLSYNLNTDKFNSTMLDSAYENIREIVNTSKDLGAKKTIFLVIPSSADIYPETVPADFKETDGERLYERFSKIATECGAEVIYPLDTMKKHANDGVGYQIYQHTDSHWSTYGAYWGTYDLFDRIAKDFPSAKPRTLSEMDFYTTEMYGGDAFFSFPKELGFEDYYRGDRMTKVTKIMELTTRYKLKMPTSTLNTVYESNNCLYLNDDNAKSATVVNPNGNGLPSALIMRDSFCKVAYDMVNDRFGKVYWGEFNNYEMPLELVDSNGVDYVIYIYSERNLLKIMMKDSAASILNLK